MNLALEEVFYDRQVNLFTFVYYYLLSGPMK